MTLKNKTVKYKIKSYEYRIKINKSSLTGKNTSKKTVEENKDLSTINCLTYQL